MDIDWDTFEILFQIIWNGISNNNFINIHNSMFKNKLLESGLHIYIYII